MAFVITEACHGAVPHRDSRRKCPEWIANRDTHSIVQSKNEKLLAESKFRVIFR